MSFRLGYAIRRSLRTSSGGGSVLRLLLPMIALIGFVAMDRAVAAEDGKSRGKLPPAEELRFNTDEFRDWLRENGLTEVLDLHLRDFPPAGRTETLLMRRALKEAEAADDDRSEEERRAAQAMANRLLEEVIAENPDALERFTWRFELAHSLIYDQAEPYFTNILYRGGRASDRRRLRPLTERALETVEKLREDIKAEYERIDNLSVREFERLDRSGFVDTLDQLAPRAQYLWLWTLYYDALGRPMTDPRRAEDLHKLAGHFRDGPSLLETAHEVSRVQVQALLLAGMAQRLLNRYPDARSYLDKAVQLGEHIVSPEERSRVQWAVTLAYVERVRVDRDDKRFDDALRQVERFRKKILEGQPVNFGLVLVTGLLERSVHRAKALEEGEGTVTAERARRRGWQALIELQERYPDRRDEVYASVFDLLDKNADPASLDPFERCALIAGLLFEDGRESDDQADLNRAIEIGESFLRDVPSGAEELVPQVRYNVAVAQYRLGRFIPAAKEFGVVAKEHPQFGLAAQAATYAVDIAARLYEEARQRPEVQELYAGALETLLFSFPENEEADYWRFYYAQWLEEQERWDAAATQYALVPGDHEHYRESVLFRLRCMARWLEEKLEPGKPMPSGAVALMTEFSNLQRSYVSSLREEITAGGDEKRLTKLIGRAELLLAEVMVLRGEDRAKDALEVLREFETKYSGLEVVIGRVWRTRLIAYDRLGRIEEAASVVPRFVESNPQNAGPALQTLYVELSEQVPQLRLRGEERLAQQKAELALLLARHVRQWSQRADVDVDAEQQRALLVQLADANLAAGRYEEARRVYEQCGASTSGSGIDETIEATVEYGHAEALYQLEEYGAALPKFNELARNIAESDPLKYQCLLRDLQCRTALKHPPGGIIKVIEQHKYLHEDFGDPALKESFEKLLRENQRRAHGN